MITALRAEDMLCADETPTNVLRADTDAHGEPVSGSPHALTVRTPDARLVWYAPIDIGSRRPSPNSPAPSDRLQHDGNLVCFPPMQL
jgi:hypothetical protein